jgi:hypothetical protein
VREDKGDFFFAIVPDSRSFLPEERVKPCSRDFLYMFGYFLNSFCIF